MFNSMLEDHAARGGQMKIKRSKPIATPYEPRSSRKVSSCPESPLHRRPKKPRHKPSLNSFEPPLFYLQPTPDDAYLRSFSSPNSDSHSCSVSSKVSSPRSGSPAISDKLSPGSPTILCILQDRRSSRDREGKESKKSSSHSRPRSELDPDLNGLADRLFKFQLPVKHEPERPESRLDVVDLDLDADHVPDSELQFAMDPESLEDFHI